MRDQADTLHADLVAIVGDKFVQPATSADAIDGVQPRWVITPGSADEVAHVLRLADGRGIKVAPRGGGTKRGWGNIPSQVDLILSLQRFDRVVEHAWGDMTATVQAGCTVARFQQVLAEHQQHLALDPLWPAKATIGGILATDDNGPRRIRFGSLRDLILGITVALPDGTVARSGGKVVKNVAGYDLPKLMTGALGTLGVIVEATFRLYPLPAQAITLSIDVPSLAAANQFVLHILDSTLTPSGLQLRVSGKRQPQVNIRFEGIADALHAQAEQLLVIAGQVDAVRAVGPEAPEVWRARESVWSGEPSVVCKTSVLPAQLAALGESVQRVAQTLKLDWKLVAQALGAAMLRLDGANDEVLLTALTILRQDITRLEGALVVLHCPVALKDRIDVWGAGGDALPLMRRVKEQFDPKDTLNPGRFVRF